MTDNQRVYDTREAMGGFIFPERVWEVYDSLKKEILLKTPLVASPRNLVLISGTQRRGNYWMELFEEGETRFLAEYTGAWTGYAHENSFPSEPGRYNLSRVKLTLQNSSKDLEERVEKIFEKHMKEEVAEAQTEEQ